MARPRNKQESGDDGNAELLSTTRFVPDLFLARRSAPEPSPSPS